MSRSSLLYDLQLIDSQLDQHKNRLKEIDTILADQTDIKRAEMTLKTKEEILRVTEKNLREAETKVKEQRLKIKQTDAKLYGGKIRNPKELQDLHGESESLKRYLSLLEDQQLESMLDVDDKKDRFETAHKALTNAIGNYTALKNELTAEKTNIELKCQVLETRRQSMVELISPEDLVVYESLRQNRLGVAVSRVNDRACSACGATLTAALYQASRSLNQITHCETCGRILFAN
jgi:predicted  nucleic acid-binding Zn-ribbon protein